MPALVWSSCQPCALAEGVPWLLLGSARPKVVSHCREESPWHRGVVGWPQVRICLPLVRDAPSLCGASPVRLPSFFPWQWSCAHRILLFATALSPLCCVCGWEGARPGTNFMLASLQIFSPPGLCSLPLEKSRALCPEGEGSWQSSETRTTPRALLVCFPSDCKSRQNDATQANAVVRLIDMQDFEVWM